MSLPTLNDLKDHLRIPQGAHGQDTLLTDKLAQATGRVRSYLCTPITAEEKTFRDPAETAVVYGAILELVLPEGPVDPDEDLTVVDADGDTVAATDYELDAELAVIRAVPGRSFGNGPYQITATVGLSADPDYSTVIEPVVRAAILDLGADLYQQRNPASMTESAGGGVSVSYAAGGLPARTASMLEQYRWRDAT